MPNTEMLEAFWERRKELIENNKDQITRLRDLHRLGAIAKDNPLYREIGSLETLNAKLIADTNGVVDWLKGQGIDATILS